MSKQPGDRAIHAWLRGRSLTKAGPLMWAIVVQLVVLSVTVFVVVLVPSRKEEPAFVAHKTIYLPQKELDHRVAQAAFEQVASPPMIMERIQSQSLAAHALPELPALPDSTFNPMVTPERLDPSASLFGASGLAGLAGNLGGQSSSLSFFGIRDQASRVVIAFDVSKSVLNKAEKSGVPITRIKEETRQLITGLDANTTFGVVQFIRRYEVFRDRLIPATEGNKKRALEWLEREFHTSGFSPTKWKRWESRSGEPEWDGIQAVMREIYAWEPDVVFILSDGGFGRNFPSQMMRIDLAELDRDLSRLSRDSGQKPRIHFIGFEVNKDREAAIQAITRKTGGRYRTF